jgi:hypothetical protein
MKGNILACRSYINKLVKAAFIKEVFTKASTHEEVLLVGGQ